MKAFKLYGEVGDVDQTNREGKMESIRNKIFTHALKDVFNCDESGLFYQMAPDRTIAPSSFAGRKAQKRASPSWPAAMPTGQSELL